MKAKLIIGLGSIVLLASSLVAGDIYYERGYNSHNNHKKSHKQIKRDSYRDSHYLTRAEKRYLKHRRMEAQERRIERREHRERKERRMAHRARAYEMDRSLAIFNLATLPLRIHHNHVKHLAFGGNSCRY